MCPNSFNYELVSGFRMVFFLDFMQNTKVLFHCFDTLNAGRHSQKYLNVTTPKCALFKFLFQKLLRTLGCTGFFHVFMIYL